MRNEVHRSKRYLYYLLGILSLFATFRSYTLDGPRTTALVWYFFPSLDFETGLTFLSYIGIIAGLGNLFTIFIQKYADKVGRKPILILISVVLTVMPLIQILTSSVIFYIPESYGIDLKNVE